MLIERRSVRAVAIGVIGTLAVLGTPPSAAPAAMRPRGVVATIASPLPHGQVFGDGVAIWGNTLLVGAPDFDNDMGRAYIYVRSGGGAWPAAPTVTLKDPHNVQGDDFGYNEVALYEGTAVVCAFQAYDGQGACYIYVRSAAGVWPARPTRILRDPSRPDHAGFGVSMAIWNGTIVIGTDNSSVRAAYVYVRGAVTWPASPTSSLRSPDDFGFAVALFNGTILVGDPDVSDVGGGDGAVYVYVKVGGRWPLNPTFKLPPPVPAEAKVFGWAVAIDKQAIVVSDQGYRPAGGAKSSGATYIYRPAINAAALPVRTLLDPGRAQGDSFGEALAISGGNLVVGAPFGSSANNLDTAYVYKEGLGWPAIPNDTFVDPNDPPGYLGDAVAIQGSVAAIPSPNADADSGKVYVYAI